MPYPNLSAVTLPTPYELNVNGFSLVDTILNDKTAHELRNSLSKYAARCKYLSDTRHPTEEFSMVQVLTAMLEAQTYWEG
jgi:hypothetical protein